VQIALHNEDAFFDLRREYFQWAERFAHGLRNDVVCKYRFCKWTVRQLDLRIVFKINEKLAQGVKRLGFERRARAAP